MITHVKDAITKITETIGQKPGQRVGYPTLDDITDGLHDTELIILAGRPSMGKSAALCDMALQLGKQGMPLIFSMEMGERTIIERMVCNLAGVSFVRAQRNQLNESEKKKLAKASSDLKNYNILLEGTSLHTPESMEQVLQEVKSAGLPVSCVMIDHLQYMRIKGMDDPLRETTYLSRYLKAFAREYKWPFLVLAQLNRGPESRDNHRPVLRDLRDSGAVEQDADQVWLMYRRSYYEPSNASSEAEIIVAKNRNGATGIAKLTWAPTSMSFRPAIRMEDF